jgi:ParB family chromosome partitioning protein
LIQKSRVSDRIPVFKKRKVVLSASRGISLTKLMLSQSTVSFAKTDVSIEELVEDIARRTLPSSITVGSVLSECGSETGTYSISKGDQRIRALDLLTT